MKCKTCKHNIAKGAMTYEACCRYCKWYPDRPDLYEPIEPKEVGNDKPPLSKVILDKFLKHSKSLDW